MDRLVPSLIRPLPRLVMVCLVLSFLVAVELSHADEVEKKPAAETPSAPPPLLKFEFQESHMGMPYKVTLYAPSEQVANDAAKAAYARIKEIDEKLSDYNADSELNALCKVAGQRKPRAVSDDLLVVLQKSLDLSAKSRGSFDVTVGPATRLWRKARRSGSAPLDREIAAAKELISYRNVKLNEETKMVELVRQKMQLDLGGIACGYAVDEAMKVLKVHQITSAMIDASGDIAVSGPPPGKAGWRIGVAPLEQDSEPSQYLMLKNASVTTSGDAFQFIEFDGVRYSHIIDPKTARGLTVRRAVVVIARDCITADSYATTLCVMGPDTGMKLIREVPGGAGLFVEVKEGATETFESETFARYVEKK